MSNNPFNIHVPINLTLELEIPYKEYVAKINEAVYAEIEAEKEKILARIRSYVGVVVDAGLEQRVNNEVKSLVQREVDLCINPGTVEKAAKAALKKATVDAIAIALGQKTKVTNA